MDLDSKTKEIHLNDLEVGFLPEKIDQRVWPFESAATLLDYVQTAILSWTEVHPDADQSFTTSEREILRHRKIQSTYVLHNLRVKIAPIAGVAIGPPVAEGAEAYLRDLADG